MRKISIQLKILLGIVIPLFISIAGILYLSTKTQQNNLLESSEKTLTTNTSILITTLKNMMLNGEAPIMVRTLGNLQNMRDIREVEIYRRDGTRAFHDYQTLETVNKNLNKEFFKRTERLANKTIDNDNFREVLETNTPIKVELENPRGMEYYFPIINEPDCRMCHGSDHFVRGVAYFRISTEDVYERINRATLLLTGVFILTGIIICLILIYFLRGIIVKPLLNIGTRVREVGMGNFEVRVSVTARDEVGDLGREINSMIKGLEERFRLSKYVSKTTDNLIRQRGVVQAEGERQRLTILFSDIRSFTPYAEKNPPSVVIKNLNRILEVQAETVLKFNGDVDKFIGDAVMAIFIDEYDAIQCAYHMIHEVVNVDKEDKTGLCIGVGINSGEVILGNIGSKSRLEYAAIGDTVNLAARLCDLAKQNMILISGSVVDALAGKVVTKLIPDQRIKGKTERVNFYVIQSILNEKTLKWMG